MEAVPAGLEGNAELRTMRGRLYSLGFIDEFGPIYALYAIWFLDNGITTAQISTVFLLWACVGLAFEVPSGALADMIDRRKLLAFAFLLRAVGIAVWLIEPTFTGVLIGASLWSTHQALSSGAWEAMIHDQLAAVGQESTYASTMARISQCSVAGVALGAGVATATTWAGATISLLGWLTVAINALSIVLVLSLPDAQWVAQIESTDDEIAVDESSLGEWWWTLRTGVGFVTMQHSDASRIASRLVVIGAFVGGLFIIDDYAPILARERGASDALIPILSIAIFGGLFIGNEVVARRPAMSPRSVGALMMIGAAAMATAVLASSKWVLMLVGFGYMTQQIIWTVGDARLQQEIPPVMRATVTSVRSFFAEVVSVLALGAVTLFSATDGGVPVNVLAVMAAILLLTGALAMRWIPRIHVQPVAPGDAARA